MGHLGPTGVGAREVGRHHRVLAVLTLVDGRGDDHGRAGGVDRVGVGQRRLVAVVVGRGDGELVLTGRRGADPGAVGHGPHPGGDAGAAGLVLAGVVGLDELALVEDGAVLR
jgi:hypothetical protein